MPMNYLWKSFVFNHVTYFKYGLLLLIRYNKYLKQPKQASTSTTAVGNQQSTSQFSRRSSSGTTSSSNNFPVRKRSYSFSEGHCKSVKSQAEIQAKRWKRSKDAKKFLLGGSVR